MTNPVDSRCDYSLARLLLLLGLIDLSALLATIMPLEWMAWIHHSCGLGTLPNGRVVGYLARTTSALYALHGAMLVFISLDVDRYRPLIRFLSWAAIVHGIILLGIDLAQGMPWFWTIVEAPGFAMTGVAMLWFLRATPASNSTNHDGEVTLQRNCDVIKDAKRSECVASQHSS